MLIGSIVNVDSFSLFSHFESIKHTDSVKKTCPTIRFRFAAAELLFVFIFFSRLI